MSYQNYKFSDQLKIPNTFQFPLLYRTDKNASQDKEDTYFCSDISQEQKNPQ